MGLPVKFKRRTYISNFRADIEDIPILWVAAPMTGLLFSL
jgi:hypothetical protein